MKQPYPFVALAAATVLTAGFSLASPRAARAQGCVASRMEAPSCAAPHGGDETRELETYNLKKGRWQSSLGYRWYRSHRHFVGSVEQNAENVANGTAERDRSGTEVVNHVHIPVVGMTYGLTDRLSLSADLPYFTALRRSPASASRPTYATHASGISDLNLMARYWLGDPAHRAPQNLALGLGLKLPTGRDKAEDDFLLRLDPSGQRIYDRRPVDNSIQPGDGGYGLIAELQAFKSLGSVTAFASGNYMVTPQEQNDYLRDPGNANPDPSSAYYSIADQFAARVGLVTSVSSHLGFSLAGRLEGVPSSDLIGGDMGRRRPGYSVALEPGVSYQWRRTQVSLSVPYLVRRVRTQNVSDKLASARTGENVIGDAAFADFVVIVGFSRRF